MIEITAEPECPLINPEFSVRPEHAAESESTRASHPRSINQPEMAGS
ncbi:hypothetical protein [Streptomyces durhamensis]|nr:hypothetical protein [Streptomyces durhamensis]